MSDYTGYCKNCERIFEYGTGCPICASPLKLIEQKDPTSYTNDIKRAINLVSIDSNNAVPFGSFIFKAQSYPSDIDVIESVSDCCSEKKVFEKMYNILHELINRIDKTKNYFFSEIKAGRDDRFNINIGEREGKFIMNYDYEYILTQIDDLFKHGLLSKDELRRLQQIVTPQIDNDNFDELKEFFRLKSTIRWSRDEIFQGYKFLPGNKMITLLQAISQKTPVKIDVWAPINGKYIEVTNFFILRVANNMINFKFDYENQIKQEIDKYFSKTFWKPFKGAKRMWGLSRHNFNKQYLYLLTPLFQSGIANINQINSEIDTLISMYQKLTYLPTDIIRNQIDTFKTRLSNIDDIDFDEKFVYLTIDKVLGSHERSTIIKLLSELEKYFKKVINEKTIEYLKYVHLYPIPKYFLTY
jgi:hypothetical protein